MLFPLDMPIMGVNIQVYTANDYKHRCEHNNTNRTLRAYCIITRLSLVHACKHNTHTCKHMIVIVHTYSKHVLLT